MHHILLEYHFQICQAFESLVYYEQKWLPEQKNKINYSEIVKKKINCPEVYIRGNIFSYIY